MGQDIVRIRAMLGPGIFRDIEIAASASLYNLAEAIVEAIGFDFDHAFGFYSKLTGSPYGSPVKYELFADMGEGREDALSVKRTAVAAAYPKDKTKLLFLFDYGDNWRFKTERLASAPRTPRTRYPRLVGSRGEAPEQYPDPEDYEDEAP